MSSQYGTRCDLRLVDAHVHLDFMREPARVAADAEALGLGLAAMTVEPAGCERLRSEVGDRPNVVYGLGIHPWWAARASEERLDAYLAAFERLLPRARVVGEAGLDAIPRHAENGGWERQLRVFRRICALAAEASCERRPIALSLHAVRCAGAVLDVLEETGAAQRCRCALHWFSGASDELWRAARLGCLFSFGERSLATKRGREYARILPGDRLLAETDQPPGEDVAWDAGRIAASLERTTDAMSQIRDEDCAALTAANACVAFGLGAGTTDDPTGAFGADIPATQP